MQSKLSFGWNLKLKIQIGEKEIRIKTFNLDQQRFSLVLCVIAVGNKLPPIIVFRGKRGSTLEKRLLKLVIENNYKI